MSLWIAPSPTLRTLFLLCASICLPATAATLSVGPDASYKSINAAARAAQDGDTVEIAAGKYSGDVALWTQKNLTIRGLGSGAELIANGAHAEGKAIWVIHDGKFDISNITFRGARVPAQNGAGIRFEHGSLRITNCRFFDNQVGILTSNDQQSELFITNSEFADAPHQTDSLPHLLYAGQIQRLEVTGSVFRNAWAGHLLKSRARINLIRYNRLYDGDEGGASYELEFPNGGWALVVGNIIGQSRQTQNPSIISYGAEKQFWPTNGLYLSHNTIVDGQPSGGGFVRIWHDRFTSSIDVIAQNNLLIGNGTFDIADDTRSGGNLRLRAGAAGTPTPPDFRLPAQTRLRAKAFASTVAPGVDLAPTEEIRPTEEFFPPVGTRKLPQHPTFPGAVQTPEAGK
jgi:hypothetical protein